MEFAASLSAFSEGPFWQAVAVFMRVGGMIAVLPAFGEQSVPARVRLVLAIAFTMIVAPAAPQAAPQDLPQMAGLLLAEASTGLALGLMLRLFVFALQVAGTIAAQATSLSQIFGGNVGPDPLPAIGNILVMAGLALATTLGLHVQVAEFILHSYTLAPQGRILPAEIITSAAISEIARSFMLAFTLAGPFLIASLIYNVTLGVINKAMPQLMVAFVGAPAITFGGLALLFLAAPLMLSLWKDAFFGFMANPFAPVPS